MGDFVGRQDVWIEEGFFPQKARKGAAVLTSRTPFGMTCVFWVGRNPRRWRKASATGGRGVGCSAVLRRYEDGDRGEQSQPRRNPREAGLKFGHYTPKTQAGVPVPLRLWNFRLVMIRG